MAFTLVSYSQSAKNSLPNVIANIIRDFTDERSVNRCKFITTCLNNSDKFKKVNRCADNSKCLFGINNIVCLGNHTLEIFTRTYIKEIFTKINPPDSCINKTLKQLKISNNANDIYQKQKVEFHRIILKKCKRLIRKSVKYNSLDTKIKIANKYVINKLSSIYESLLINITTLWKY